MSLSLSDLPDWAPVEISAPEPTPPEEWPEARPLTRELPEAQPFPVDALGSVLGPMTKRLMDVVGAPDALCAQSVLAAATLAAQPFVDVSMDGRTNPISAYFVTIAQSGERKSAIDSHVLRPVREFERTLDEKYRSEKLCYLNDRDSYEATRKRVLNQKKLSRSQAAEELNKLGPPPAPPMEPMIICQEPTYEGLVRNMTNGYPSQGIFSAEGGRFLNGHAMSDENRIKTSTGLSEFWDGAAITRVRSGDGAATLLGRRLSMHLMVQPQIAFALLGDAALRDQGILSRCLVVYPESTMGTRFYKEEDVWNHRSAQVFADTIAKLLNYKWPVGDNGLSPRPLLLSSDAKLVWKKFYNAVERRQFADGDLRVISGFAGKAPDYALRLAAILSVVENIEAAHIKKDAVDCAIALIQHYLVEASRLTHSTPVSDELENARELLTWLKSGPFDNRGWVHLTEIYQLGPNKIRNARLARLSANTLEEHGYLQKIDGGREADGHHRKDAWWIRP